MKIKTSELIGKPLDYAVTLIEAPDALRYGVSDWLEQSSDKTQGGIECGGYVYRWSDSWQQAGPIIEREEIFLAKSILGGWTGSIMTHDERVRCTMHGGPTPLVAAMRCYVASKLGEEVEVPDEA